MRNCVIIANSADRDANGSCALISGISLPKYLRQISIALSTILLSHVEINVDINIIPEANYWSSDDFARAVFANIIDSMIIGYFFNSRSVKSKLHSYPN